MNERIQKLYDLYSQNGLISTTDLNTFASATPEQQQKLYDLGVSKGLFKTVDFATFSTAFTPKKKTRPSPRQKKQPQAPSPQVRLHHRRLVHRSNLHPQVLSLLRSLRDLVKSNFLDFRSQQRRHLKLHV